jgi:hydroxymethylbilane synthase
VPQRIFLIGTRQSRLAVRQTEIVLESLRFAHPDTSLEVRTVRTTGDASPASLSEIGGRGVFVIELERALLAGDIDIAVHSLKDLPSLETVGLTIAAVGRREEPRDALVARDGLALADLPPGATVGSGSPRRAAQLLALRPDLRIADIRGNVDTRIRKVQDGEYDAVIVAAAGLARLGWLGQATELLPVDTMLPAVGQGALAVQVRAGDGEATQLVQAADDPTTRVATTAERAFERGLGACLPDGRAGCQAAVAALGEVARDRLRLRGLVADPAGGRLLRDEVEGHSRDGELMGGGLAGRLLERGAAALLLEAAS